MHVIYLNWFGVVIYASVNAESVNCIIHVRLVTD